MVYKRIIANTVGESIGSNLFLYYSRDRLYSSDEGGWVEASTISGETSTRLVYICPLLPRALYVLLNCGPLCFIHYRPHIHRLIQTAPHPEMGEPHLDFLYELVVYGLLYQKLRAGTADLKQPLKFS